MSDVLLDDEVGTCEICNNARTCVRNRLLPNLVDGQSVVTLIRVCSSCYLEYKPA